MKPKLRDELKSAGSDLNKAARVVALFAPPGAELPEAARTDSLRIYRRAFPAQTIPELLQSDRRVVLSKMEDFYIEISEDREAEVGRCVSCRLDFYKSDRCPWCGHETLASMYPEMAIFESPSDPCYRCGTADDGKTRGTKEMFEKKEGEDDREKTEIKAEDDNPEPSVPTNKTIWSQAYVNDLPDTAFAYVEPGGQIDKAGKTMPRALRRFPYKDKKGTVCKEALAVAVKNISGHPREMKRLTKLAKKLGLDVDTQNEWIETDTALTRVLAKVSDNVTRRVVSLFKGPGQPCGVQAVLSLVDNRWSPCSFVFEKSVFSNKEDAQAFSDALCKNIGDSPDIGPLPEIEGSEGTLVMHAQFFDVKYADTEKSADELLKQQDALLSISIGDDDGGVSFFAGLVKGSEGFDTFPDVEALRVFAADECGADLLTNEQIVLTKTAGAYPRLSTYTKSFPIFSSGFTVALSEPDRLRLELDRGGSFEICKQGDLGWIVVGSRETELSKDLEDGRRYDVIRKSTDELRYTLGVAYAPNEVDAHKDFMEPEDLRKTAWKFLRSPRAGLDHADGTEDGHEVVESYIYQGPDWNIGGRVVKAGMWLVGVVWSEDAWNDIKLGKRRGYSFQGLGRRELAQHA